MTTAYGQCLPLFVRPPPPGIGICLLFGVNPPPRSGGRCQLLLPTGLGEYDTMGSAALLALLVSDTPSLRYMPKLP